MSAPEPPVVPPLYWDGCQFYADTGRGTHYVDAPYEGRYAVMYLHSSGHWAHQGNTDELPETVMRLNLPSDVASAAVPDTGQAPAGLGYRYRGPLRAGQVATAQDDLARLDAMIMAAPADYPGLPLIRRHRDEVRALLDSTTEEDS